MRYLKLSLKIIASLALLMAAIMLTFYSVGHYQLSQRQLELVKGDANSLALVNQDALNNLLEQSELTNSSALVLLKEGELVAAWYDRGNIERIETMSATKSIVSLALGRAWTLGLIDDLDVAADKFFPAWQQAPYDDITLKHLLDHSSGIQARRQGVFIYPNRDFVQHALESELLSEPGERFFYNNKTSNLIPAVIKQLTGKNIDEFLRDDLFAELGIVDFSWAYDRAGNAHGLAGFAALPEDLAKLGQLVLDRGVYKEQQLIDNKWFDLSFTVNPSVSLDYALQWWLSYDMQVKVTDKQIDFLRQQGVKAPLLNALSKIKGNYDSLDRYVEALKAVLDDDYTSSFFLTHRSDYRGALTEVYLEKMNYFAANGHLGQHIIGFPETGLLAVRMYKHSYPIDFAYILSEGKDGFSDFASYLEALTKE